MCLVRRAALPLRKKSNRFFPRDRWHCAYLLGPTQSARASRGPVTPPRAPGNPRLDNRAAACLSPVFVRPPPGNFAELMPGLPRSSRAFSPGSQFSSFASTAIRTDFTAASFVLFLTNRPCDECVTVVRIMGGIIRKCSIEIRVFGGDKRIWKLHGYIGQRCDFSVVRRSNFTSDFSAGRKKRGALGQLPGTSLSGVMPRRKEAKKLGPKKKAAGRYKRRENESSASGGERERKARAAEAR